MMREEIEILLTVATSAVKRRPEDMSEEEKVAVCIAAGCSYLVRGEKLVLANKCIIFPINGKIKVLEKAGNGADEDALS